MISVIADIGLDHMEVLGNTIEEIAKQKAGIIKENMDTVMYPQQKVSKIIEEKCKENKNTLHLVKKEEIKNICIEGEYQKLDYKNYQNIEINLKGKCQIQNSAVTIEVINILNQKGYKINEKAIKEGLKTVIHKARFEIIHQNPKIIFDGGHNEDSIINLKQTINDYYLENKKIFIVSILKTKDYKKIIELLTQDKEAKFIFTSGNNKEKYVSKEELYEEAKKYLSKNIYKEELKTVISEIKQKCKNEVIFVIRKLLYIPRVEIGRRRIYMRKWG